MLTPACRLVVGSMFRIGFSVWLVSGCAHTFILLSVVIVTLPSVKLPQTDEGMKPNVALNRIQKEGMRRSARREVWRSRLILFPTPPSGEEPRATAAVGSPQIALAHETAAAVERRIVVAVRRRAPVVPATTQCRLPTGPATSTHKSRHAPQYTGWTQKQ